MPSPSLAHLDTRMRAILREAKAGLAARYAGRPWLDVRSKGDLPAQPGAEAPAGALAVSVETGEGVAELKAVLVALLAGMRLAAGQELSTAGERGKGGTGTEC